MIIAIKNMRLDKELIGHSERGSKYDNDMQNKFHTV